MSPIHMRDAKRTPDGAQRRLVLWLREKIADLIPEKDNG